jgi:hypothetical protein
VKIGGILGKFTVESLIHRPSEFTEGQCHLFHAKAAKIKKDTKAAFGEATPNHPDPGGSQIGRLPLG